MISLQQAVLLGSSHTVHLGEWAKKAKRFPPRTFAFGIGGDGLQHLLMRLHLTASVLSGQTNCFVVLIGGNNLNGGTPEYYARLEDGGEETHRSKIATPGEIGASGTTTP